jgi:serine/threonine protein kinase/Tol biopolymer transport system component
MIGSVIGHYEIVEKLGEGGMGVVYKARDTRLNRFVAIKLLRPEKVSDKDRIHRFIHEARAASALNHPNIVTIHEISIHDGAPYIVMEYVPGKTLDRLIPRRGMSLGEMLKVGSQVAGALAAAAVAGVIHRDVKPANVAVTHGGDVKVLDFGLAKLCERPASSEQPTATVAAGESEQPLSREGSILGTVSYMSPEQAEGKPLDSRSDIFSFGAMLYEMATGERAFRGETSMSTMSSILRDEPPPPSQLAANVPHDLEKIILRCLRKDPERRFQNMADVRVALLELKEESESGQVLRRTAVPGRRRIWLWALCAVTVLSAAGLWLMERRAIRLPQTLVPVTTYPGSELYPSFSPDGKQIAFFWDGENSVNPGIYVKLLGETNALRLTTGPDRYPGWAPDGKRIAFVRMGPNHGVYTVSALGGAERKLAETIPNAATAGIATNLQISWSPDGNWISLPLNDEKNRGILLLPVAGGEQPRRISKPTPPAFDECPTFAANGPRLAYARCSGQYSCDIYVQELSSTFYPRGSARRVTRQGAYVGGLTWSRDGASLIYAASHAAGILPYLWRVGIDGRRQPERLEIAGPMAYSPSASSTADRLVFSRLLRDYDIWAYHTDAGMQPVITSSLADYNPQFSPDGTRIAFESSRSAEAEEVWVVQADGSKPIQMTNQIGRHQGTPRWSPDGRRIAFDSQGLDGHWDIYVMEANGGLPRRVTSEPSDENMPFWSRDGKWLYFRSDRTGRTEIWRVPSDGGRPEQITMRGGSVAYESADGKTLFYMKNNSGLFSREHSPEARSVNCCRTSTTNRFSPWRRGSTTSEPGAMRGFIRWSSSSSRTVPAGCWRKSKVKLIRA